MSRRWKKILIYLSVFVVLAISSAITVAYFSEERIRVLAVEQLNTILKTDVQVEKINFSLLKRFPKASIEFKNISIQEVSSRKEKQNVLAASSLFLEFNPFNLLTGTYVVDAIYVNESKLNIAYFKDGSNNFQFFKEGEANEEFKISLQKVRFSNVVLQYTDDKSGVYFKSNTKLLTLSGDFESKVFDLALTSNGDMEFFQINRFRTKKTSPYKLDLVLNIQREENSFRFKKASVLFDKIPLVLNGDYQKKDETAFLNIAFQTDDFKFKDAMFLIPKNARDNFNKYNAKGILKVEGQIQGQMDSRSTPSMNFSYELVNGEMDHKESKLYFRDIVFKGSFTNGEAQSNRTSEFTIEEASFKSTFGENSGSLTLSNFDHPFMKFELSSSMDLDKLKEIINNDSLEVLEGQCEYSIAGETYLDSLSSIGVNDVKEARANGYLKVRNGKVKWIGYKHAVDHIYAESRFGNNRVFIDSLYYDMAGVGSSVRGRLHNFLPYLFFDNENLSAQIKLIYDDLDMNKIVTSDENDTERAGFILPVSEEIKLNVNLSARKFSMEKFKAKNVQCVIVSNYPYFLVKDLSLNTMEGEFKGWMKFDVKNQDNIYCSSQLDLYHINISELFHQFNNFGQSSIVSENLVGYADASINYKSAFDRNLNLKQESVESICHLEIRNGRLVNYEPILALSKYVDVEELRDISFSKLTNDIEINKRMVYIPEMDVKSSAMELKLSGKHSFDNEIDYHFRLWLDEILFRKAKKSKKNKEEFGEVEVDDEGRAKLYIRMQGTVDDYKIKLDRKALREKWKEDFKEERKELKDLFKKEFGGESEEKEVDPINIGIEWEEFEEEEEKNGDFKVESSKSDQEKENSKTEEKDKKKKKSLLDKLGKGVEDEYEEYDADKFD